MPTTKPWFELAEGDGVTVATFAGPRIADREVVRRIEEQLFELVEARECRRLLLDLTAVEYLSSMFLSTLIRVYAKMRRREGRVLLCGIKPEIAEVLHLTKLDKTWEIYADRELAVAAAQS